MPSFKELGLDDKLCQALREQRLDTPTMIQEKCIDLSLNDRKDIVARARTGSGKTLAYVLPVLQRLLHDPPSPGAKALMLVPTRELADQLSKVLASLTAKCQDQITAVDISQQTSNTVKVSALRRNPQIVVATPSSARALIESKVLPLDSVDYLVLDEADLLISYGFEDDLESLQNALTTKVQTWLISATASDDVDKLKKTFCKSPAVLTLKDTADKNQLKQYYVKCSELDKFLLSYVIFKLNLIKGKTVIFVNDIDRCYRLKLFLEQFGIKSAALNADLPLASRVHILESFNNNAFHILIATDEARVANAEQTNSKKSKRTDGEYGVSRGVDFKNVSCVVNFDMPLSSRVYAHRIGRTARAKKSGISLSFIIPSAEFGKHKTAMVATARKDERSLEKVIAAQTSAGNEILPYQFDMKLVESFRYRMDDAFRAVTKAAVREARAQELQNEILASEKLQRHFEENPEDLAALSHTKDSHAVRVQTELKRVPDYLLPASAKVSKPIYVQEPGRPFRKFKKGKKSQGSNGKSHRSKRRDPLKFK